MTIRLLRVMDVLIRLFSDLLATESEVRMWAADAVIWAGGWVILSDG